MGMCNISARLGVKLPSNKNMQHVCLIDSEIFTIVMSITVISLYYSQYLQFNVLGFFVHFMILKIQ